MHTCVCAVTNLSGKLWHSLVLCTVVQGNQCTLYSRYSMQFDDVPVTCPMCKSTSASENTTCTSSSADLIDKRIAY